MEKRKFMKNIEPVKEDNRERLNEMGPEPQWGIYHKTRTEDFTENWKHEYETLTSRYKHYDKDLREWERKKQQTDLKNRNFERTVKWVFGILSQNPKNQRPEQEN